MRPLPRGPFPLAGYGCVLDLADGIPPELCFAGGYGTADDERIIGMLGHTMLNPIFENNGPLVAHRRHFSWISNGETAYRLEKVTPAIASKVSRI